MTIPRRFRILRHETFAEGFSEPDYHRTRTLFYLQEFRYGWLGWLGKMSWHDVKCLDTFEEAETAMVNIQKLPTLKQVWP